MLKMASRSPSSDKTGAGTRSVNRGGWAKVPAVIVPLFWLIKIITTGVGEASSDLLVSRLGIGLAAALTTIVTIFALAQQLRGDRYHPQTYWFAVTAIAVFATVASDVFSPYSGGPLNVPIEDVTAGYLIALIAAFVTWYAVERTLSIHSITTLRREVFYWITITLAFALGTAFGDYVAFQLNAGLNASIYIFGGVVGLAGLAWLAGILDPVSAFWIAYIATRPLGASISDRLAAPPPDGVGYGTNVVAPVGLALTALLVAYLWWSREDAEQGAPTGRFQRRQSDDV
jgi:uncharacterized membrane-anchored protein